MGVLAAVIAVVLTWKGYSRLQPTSGALLGQMGLLGEDSARVKQMVKCPECGKKMKHNKTAHFYFCCGWILPEEQARESAITFEKVEQV